MLINIPEDIPSTMSAVLLTGHGGLNKLEYREDVPVPQPKEDEVLIRVAASSVNNTDINTRIGWYSKTVSTATGAGAENGFDLTKEAVGTWSGTALAFPRIQGADCCGHIVAVGSTVSAKRIGERVLVRPMMITNTKLATELETAHKTSSHTEHNAQASTKPSANTQIQPATESSAVECITLGSERDGAFAEYTTAPSIESYAIQSKWSSEALATLPCAYSTAEGLLHRSMVGAGDRVFITGASGGVGSAAIQLAKRRGATVIAQTSKEKMQALLALGADEVCGRDDNLVETLGKNSVEVVIDLVGGAQWEQLLEILRPYGRYAVAGAVAGPIVPLDLRTLYLKDLSFYGSTFHSDKIFSNLISYVEHNEIQAFVSKIYPLENIVQAQKDFLDKRYAGKLVLVPTKREVPKK